jgi:hypothetical protein
MTKHKSARHHWWPECVSKHWAREDGCVSWLLPNGTTKALPPSQLGAISNGHMIRLSAIPGGETPWDQDFESHFNRADSAFPNIIDWLLSLEHRSTPFATVQERFINQASSDAQLCLLTECVVSLAVRSPMTRAYAISLAEKMRGPLREPEKSALVGLNIRQLQRDASDGIGSRAKYVVIFSPEKEFIFGDGFFHNVTSALNGLFLPEILAPITPEISVLIARPWKYSPEPKLTTLVCTPAETERLNQAVQTYAKRFLFYRSEKPEVSPHYSVEKHLRFDGPNDILGLIHSIPGVPDRDRNLDALLRGCSS